MSDTFDVDPEDGTIVDVDFVTKDLTMKLKDLRDANVQQWAKIIANPHSYAVESIDDLPQGDNSSGDGYLIGGILWVWSEEQDQFLETGNIQGPGGETGAPGEDGDPGEDG